MSCEIVLGVKGNRLTSLTRFLLHVLFVIRFIKDKTLIFNIISKKRFSSSLVSVFLLSRRLIILGVFNPRNHFLCKSEDFVHNREDLA